MKNQILREIQMDIRNNFGKNVDWTSLPKENFNCFMFAIKNTIPTEKFDHQKGDQVFLKSLINEKVAYFGHIGQRAGTMFITNMLSHTFPLSPETIYCASRPIYYSWTHTGRYKCR